MTTPKGPAGEIFYLRKLSVYNLTIYNLGNQDVLCDLWDETQGKRGANEISSCIYNYILQHNNIKEVKMMSDGCGGQQKNSIFAEMCVSLLKTHPTLELIDHKFFQTGHTEMECDSIHSKIEKKSKYTPVYTPDGWAQIIHTARSSPSPFQVNMLTYDDFYDFKLLSSKVNLKNLPWHKICWLQYRKISPTKFFYKTCFKSEFLEMDIKIKKGRQSSELKKAYMTELTISTPKQKDLLKMCDDLTIPKAYHKFYKALESNSLERDCLPEPDMNEDSEYEDC